MSGKYSQFLKGNEPSNVPETLNLSKVMWLCTSATPASIDALYSYAHAVSH